MSQNDGVPPAGSGYSAEPEPCSTVSAVPVSIPNAALNTDRELWRSDEDHYCDRVTVTEGGGIGMHAAFGRVVVKTVGEWHYLDREVERLKAGYAAFPRDIAAVMADMGCGDGGVYSAATIASQTGLPEKRVKAIHKALKVLGLASFGPLCDADADGYVARGSGYWLSGRGEDLACALPASGTLTEGGDVKQAPGASLSGPTAESGDAHPLGQSR